MVPEDCLLALLPRFQAERKSTQDRHHKSTLACFHMSPDDLRKVCSIQYLVRITLCDAEEVRGRLQIVESDGSSDRMQPEVLLSENGGRQIAKSGLLSNPVVKDIDVFRDLAFGTLAGCEATLMHQFGLQRSPATLHWRVAHQFAIEHLLDPAKVEPALVGSDAGDGRDLGLVGCRHGELAIQQVWHQR